MCDGASQQTRVIEERLTAHMTGRRLHPHRYHHPFVVEQPTLRPIAEQLPRRAAVCPGELLVGDLPRGPRRTPGPHVPDRRSTAGVRRTRGEFRVPGLLDREGFEQSLARGTSPARRARNASTLPEVGGARAAGRVRLRPTPCRPFAAVEPFSARPHTCHNVASPRIAAGGLPQSRRDHPGPRSPMQPRPQSVSRALSGYRETPRRETCRACSLSPDSKLGLTAIP